MSDLVVHARRFPRFAVVGASGVLVNLGVFWLGHYLVGLPLAVASVTGVGASVLSNFLLNRCWTFQRRDAGLRRFVRFGLVSLAGMSITTGVLLFLTSRAISPTLSDLMGIGCATGLTFLLNSFWTFA
ncbi:MAG: GtrA family protein [Thermaerobacter sp.]|nr:GtrA family protein [Thermaerobacter sp.]